MEHKVCMPEGPNAVCRSQVIEIGETGTSAPSVSTSTESEYEYEYGESEDYDEEVGDFSDNNGEGVEDLGETNDREEDNNYICKDKDYAKFGKKCYKVG